MHAGRSIGPASAPGDGSPWYDRPSLSSSTECRVAVAASAMNGAGRPAIQLRTVLRRRPRTQPNPPPGLDQAASRCPVTSVLPPSPPSPPRPVQESEEVAARTDSRGVLMVCFAGVRRDIVEMDRPSTGTLGPHAKLNVSEGWVRRARAGFPQDRQDRVQHRPRGGSPERSSRRRPCPGTSRTGRVGTRPRAVGHDTRCGPAVAWNGINEDALAVERGGGDLRAVRRTCAEAVWPPVDPDRLVFIDDTKSKGERRRTLRHGRTAAAYRARRYSRRCPTRAGGRRRCVPGVYGALVDRGLQAGGRGGDRQALRTRGDGRTRGAHVGGRVRGVPAGEVAGHEARPNWILRCSPGRFGMGRRGRQRSSAGRPRAGPIVRGRAPLVHPPRTPPDRMRSDTDARAAFRHGRTSRPPACVAGRRSDVQ